MTASYKWEKADDKRTAVERVNSRLDVSFHNGGRVKIGPDHKLYVTTGDAGDKANAQERQSLAGKILRLALDGKVPADNPFPHSYVFSYGHRNPQGLAWNEDGHLYSAEHGPTAHDEINRIVPGHNYGWPVITGGETKKGLETPLFHSGDETWAPSGLSFADGKLYIAGLRGVQIRRFDLTHERSERIFQGVGRLRDVWVDDRAIYVITNNRDGRGDPEQEDDRLLKLNLK